MTLARISLKSSGPRSLTLKARRFVQGKTHIVTGREDIAFFKRAADLHVVVLEDSEPVSDCPPVTSVVDEAASPPDQVPAGAADELRSDPEPEVPSRTKLSRMKRQELLDLADALDLAFEDSVSRGELVNLIAESEG